MAKKKKMSAPTCAVILIGNELLSGRTPDQNLNYIARRMNDIGVRMVECRIIPDIRSTIIETVLELKDKYSYVFTTGGIGPTHDDITASSIADAFGVDIIRDEKTVKVFEEYFGDKLTEATLKMAHFPEGAVLVRNDATIAPGFRMENVFCMAGIPRVMQVMIEAIVPQLEHGEDIYTKSVDVFAPEGQISQPFEDIQNIYPNVELGSYPFKSGGRVGTSLVGRSVDKENLEKAFHQIKNLINELGIDSR